MAPLLRRIRSVFTRSRVRDEIQRELDLHIEMEVEHRRARGLSFDEARRTALRDFGGVGRIREEVHDSRGLTTWDALAHDARFAVAALRRSPLFTMSAAGMIALGIAAATVLLAVVNALFLQPLPYDSATRLVTVFGTFDEEGPGGRHSLSNQEIREIAARSTTLEAIAPFAGWRTVNLGPEHGGEAERLYVNTVPGEYFEMLAARPLLGRTFFRDEGRRADPVVIVSERVWRGRLGARADIIGTDIVLSGRSYEVAGVLPETFRDLNVEIPPDVWIPLGMAPVVYGAAALETWTGRMFVAVARLREGMTPRQAQADLDAIAASLARERPDSNRGAGFNVESLPDFFFARLQRPAIVLTAAAGLVLLIACANVTTLLLLRGRVRGQEFALRAALGASGRRLAAPMIAEILILVAAGSAGGILIAGWVCQAIAASGHLQLPAFATLALDARVVAGAVALAAAAAVGIALGPALRVAGARGELLLRSDRGSVGQRDRLRSLLIGVEAAFGVVLLSGAVSLTGEFIRLRDGNISFPIEQLIASRIDLRTPRYEPPDARRQFAQQLDVALASTPATERTAIWGPSIPGRAHFYLEAVNTPAAGRDEAVRVWRHHVSPGALGVVGIGIVRGRDFDSRDDARALRVAVVSEAMAARLWPGADPIGQRFWFRGLDQPLTVVGTAEDVSPTGDLSAAMPYAVYLAYAQSPEPSMVLVARTTDERAHVQGVRAALAGLDATLPVYDVATLRARLDEENAPVRFGAAVMAAYAGIALALAAAGIYAVIGFVVATRTREFGVRLALGATRAHLWRLVLVQGLAPATLGAVAGCALALGAARISAPLGVPFGVPWFVCGAAALALLTVTLLAACIPAARAASVAPMAALRS